MTNMQKIMEIMANPMTIMILGTLSGIGLAAVMLYLDKRQEEQIKRLKLENYFNYKAIQIICEHLKTEDTINWLDIWEETHKRISEEE